MGERVKIALGFIGALIAMLATFVFVGLGVAYTLLFLNFSGPESVVEPCFRDRIHLWSHLRFGGGVPYLPLPLSSILV
jgi:hypothetical protein